MAAPGPREEGPSCCARFFRWCRHCWAADEDEDASEPRSRALQDREDIRHRYEAPPVPSSPGGVIVQQQRATQAYTDEADAGPLLPKTAESSAPLPRMGHSRNNSSASASAAPAGTSAAAAGESTPKRRSAQDGQLGLGPGGEAPTPSHRRVASYGDGKQRRAHKVHDGVAAETSTSGSGVAAAAAAAAAAGTGAAALVSGSGAAVPSTAAGRPGAAFGPMQVEDDDFCPTCLENYTQENPKIFTECGHHFHMPCIYAWLERKDTCPMCESPMTGFGV